MTTLADPDLQEGELKYLTLISYILTNFFFCKFPKNFLSSNISDNLFYLFFNHSPLLPNFFILGARGPNSSLFTHQLFHPFFFGITTFTPIYSILLLYNAFLLCPRGTKLYCQNGWEPWPEKPFGSATP